MRPLAGSRARCVRARRRRRVSRAARRRTRTGSTAARVAVVELFTEDAASRRGRAQCAAARSSRRLRRARGRHDAPHAHLVLNPSCVGTGRGRDEVRSDLRAVRARGCGGSHGEPARAARAVEVRRIGWRAAGSPLADREPSLQLLAGSRDAGLIAPIEGMARNLKATSSWCSTCRRGLAALLRTRGQAASRTRRRGSPLASGASARAAPPPGHASADPSASTYRSRRPARSASRCPSCRHAWRGLALSGRHGPWNGDDLLSGAPSMVDYEGELGRDQARPASEHGRPHRRRRRLRARRSASGRCKARTRRWAGQALPRLQAVRSGRRDGRRAVASSRSTLSSRRS